jgi:hypothetical protein
MKLWHMFFVVIILLSSVLIGQPREGSRMIAGSTNLLGNIHQFGAGSLAPNNNLGIYFGKVRRLVNGKEVSSSKVTVFNITPTFGKLLTNKTMLGLSTGVYYFSINNGNSNDGSSTIISATPFYRYYGGKMGSVFPYLELKAGGAVLFYNDDRNIGGILGGKIAFSHFIKSRIALDIFADYTLTLNEDQGNDNVFGLGVGFSLFK